MIKTMTPNHSLSNKHVNLFDHKYNDFEISFVCKYQNNITRALILYVEAFITSITILFSLLSAKAEALYSKIS